MVQRIPEHVHSAKQIMFKRGDILISQDCYTHPGDTKYPLTFPSPGIITIEVGTIVEVMKAYDGALDIWIPSLGKYTCGTFASHFKKISK